jgi:hypothetical protein
MRADVTSDTDTRSAPPPPPLRRDNCLPAEEHDVWDRSLGSA